MSLSNGKHQIQKSRSGAFEMSKLSARSRKSSMSQRASVQSYDTFNHLKNEASNHFYDKNLGKAIDHFV